MLCAVESKNIRQIHSTNTLTQTAFWAHVKQAQGFEPYAFQIAATNDLVSPDNDGHEKICDDLLVLVRYINNDYCFAYIPYGPKVQPDFENYGVFLEELSEALRPRLPNDCILIRYDLPWKNQWAAEDDYYDHNGNWIGPPSVSSQELRLNINTQKWNLQKSPSDILPANTFFLDLKQEEDMLMQKMKSKTRYNIRLSFRKGIRVQEYGPEKLEEWYSLYRETAIRNNLTLHHKNYFKSILSNRQKSGKGVRSKLLMADFEGEFLAAMFLLFSRNRGTYLYGASSSSKRNLMATYAIQWEAIKRTREAGFKEYDMFGSAPNLSPSHPMHGLYRFKSGFGGRLFHRMGCWDYPLATDEYRVFKSQEVNSQKYYHGK